MTPVAPPVLLLHGWGGSFDAIWRKTGWVDALVQAGREVIAMDLPGHGVVGGAHNPDSYDDLAGQVERRLPRDVVIDVVGYSLGAKLALAMVGADPGRFGRVVLGGLGANAYAPEKLGEVVAKALVEGVTETTADQIRMFVGYALAAGNDPKAVAAVLRRSPNPLLSAVDVARITNKVLLVSGDRDAIALPLEPLSNALPDVSSLMLPGVNHIDLPGNEAFRNAALEFLAQGVGPKEQFESRRQ